MIALIAKQIEWSRRVFGAGDKTGSVTARWKATAAVIDVIAERMRQVEGEGFTPERDDAEHDDGDLAAAAAGYAMNAADQLNPFSQGDNDGALPDFWPFDDEAWKPGDARRDLVKAAALTIAEIERLDRAEARKAGAAS